MPDWSYRTVFRPVLFRLPSRKGRSVALGVMGRLGRSWWGRHLIEFMGHFQLDPDLERSHADLTFKSPVGIGCRLDPELRATEALSQMGVGFLEIGPVTAQDTDSPRIRIDSSQEEIVYSPCPENVPLDRALTVVKKTLDVPVFARVQVNDPTAHQVVEQLGEHVGGFILTDLEELLPSEEAWNTLRRSLSQNSCRVLLHVSSKNRDSVANWNETLQPDGFVVEGSCPEPAVSSLRFGQAAFSETLQLTEQVYSQVGPQKLLVATGGIHEPRDGLQLLESGANLVLVDTGITFSGPGLPKRINDAVLSCLPNVVTQDSHETKPVTKMSWFWTLLMGAALFLGGVMAFVIATTRVVLPYDESQSGLTRADLMLINDRLLDFMQHDRVTLAGTMFGLGLLYLCLSWQGSRHGWHWAHIACLSSAFIGFSSFFLFLGFGYFDPFHAFVTALLFQLMIMAMHSDMPRITNRCLPELTNDAAWQRSQWGQLLLVVHGFMLIAAGATISIFGMTSVFVPQDLEFMQTTYAEICTSDPSLLPLVAHDRATFGGMTLSTGVTVLLCGLWGFRRGNRWLWRSLMTGGSLCYLTTFWIHWKVGYISLEHLIPVYGGLSALWLTGLLSHQHLCSVQYPSETSHIR